MSAKLEVKNRQKAPWLEPNLMTFLISSMFFTAFCCIATAVEPDSKESKTVSLIIDYADGSERRFKEIPWRNELNVMDVMSFAKKHSRGIKFEYAGKGSTAFIKQIDDLKNEGGSGKNWIYRVNEKLGDKSFAIYALNPRDTVLWKFDVYP